MSAIKVRIQSTERFRTEVSVDGKFAYQTGNHPKVEKEHLDKLFEVLVLENIEVEVVEK